MEEEIAQFKMVTGCEDLAQIQRCLAAAQGDVQEAVELYFSQGDRTSAPAEPIRSQPTSSRPPTTTPKRSGGVMGFRDLQNQDDDDDDHGDDKEKMSWFTGGEKSGLAVQAPPKKPNRDEILDKLLKEAQANGGVHASEYEREQERFGGGGYRLGNDANTNTHVPAQNRPAARVAVALYRNGFTVGDGDVLRNYQDPASQEFLRVLGEGRVPQELHHLAAQSNKPLEIDLKELRNEDWTPPPMKPFSGSGHTLGSTPSAPASTSSNASTSSPITRTAPTVDTSQPTTNVQIRLADGSRLVAQFNHTHTIGDIRRYIDGGSIGANYDIITTFPPKTFADDSQTIKDAGLINAAVVQKKK
eukprot:TRINITY_DN17249_c0_g1_i1.p1 TRINITY_DN17249_c0_g1~~TRINITY_DN17249_c0_g1_i1.p1  ORF type:complete len:358 (+),score=96.37 TRINITY_DN17249_c0_g1_i1:62-1135(+)